MPSGATLLIIYPQDTPNTGRYKINYNFSILAFSSFTGISASKFTNPNPTTQTVGGIQAGSTFGGDYYLQDMMDLLLYPAVTPNFSSFLISAQATSLEVGATVAGTKTFTWSIANAGDLEPNSIDIEDTTNSTILATSLADDGAETVFLSSVSRTTPGANIWTISAQDTDLVTFTREYQIDWYYAVFYGINGSTTLNAAAIAALSGYDLVSDIDGTYPLAGSGYGYICVPDSFSTPNGFRDSTTNLPIEMAGVSEGYNYFDGAFYYDSVSVTRNSIPITYRVYRTRNTISTVTIGVALTGGTVATLQSVINAGNIANGNAAILGNFSATTFYSGSTPLNTILGNYLAGLTTYVQPGSNITTGGTPTAPIISVSGSPVFTSVTATSVFATNLSGGTIYSGNTNLGVLFGNLFAPISVTNTYVQEGWNIVTGGTPTRPIISVYAYPQFSSVTTTSMSAYTVFSNTISGNTFYSGNTPLNTILEQFGSINTTYVQPGSNIATGGTPNSPTVSVIGEPVFTGITAGWVNALVELSGFTIYSAGTNLSHVLEGIVTYVQPGLNITTGGTKYRPIINLAGNIVVTGVTAVTLSVTSLSAGTFYSGSTSLNDILSNFSSGSNTYVQPGLNITTGGTDNLPIINLAGTITLTAVTSNSITATTYYSGSTPLNELLTAGNVWQAAAGVTNSIEPISSPGTVQGDNAIAFGTTIGVGSNGAYGFGANGLIADASKYSSLFGGDANEIGNGVSNSTVIGGFSNRIRDGNFASVIIGGEGNDISFNAYESVIIGNTSVIGSGSSYTSVFGGAAHNIGTASYGSSIVGGISNTELSGSQFSSIIGGRDNMVLRDVSGSTILGGVFITASTSFTTYVPYLNIGSIITSASTYVLGIQSNGDVTKMLYAGGSGTTTFVQGGLNITTGGTESEPIINLAGSISLTGVTVSGNLTDLRGYDLNGVYYQRSDNEIVASADITFDEDLSIFNVIGTISGTTFYSGGTSFNDILSSFGPSTFVQPGSNISTGGTPYAPVVNVVDSPAFNNITSSGTSNLNNIEVGGFANFYGGATFQLAGPIEFQDGINVISQAFTNGLTDSFRINAQQITATTIYANVVSATTFYSGSTDISQLLSSFGPSTYVQPGSNITTGGTASAPIVSVLGSPTFTAVTASSISGTSVSATTFYSGSTQLGLLFASSSVQNQWVQPGVNAYTGGTANAPIVGVIGSPTFTAVTANSIYSASTNIQDLFQDRYSYINSFLFMGA